MDQLFSRHSAAQKINVRAHGISLQASRRTFLCNSSSAFKCCGCEDVPLISIYRRFVVVLSRQSVRQPPNVVGSIDGFPCKPVSQWFEVRPVPRKICFLLLREENRRELRFDIRKMKAGFVFKCFSWPFLGSGEMNLARSAHVDFCRFSLGFLIFLAADIMSRQRILPLWQPTTLRVSGVLILSGSNLPE